MIVNLKKIAERVPESLGRILIGIPFDWRLGKQYTLAKEGFNNYPVFNRRAQKDCIFQRMKRIVDLASKENEFYRDFYGRHNFNPSQLRSFEDIKDIPIVTKADLRLYSLEKRSCPQRGRLKVNTGGTSGEPLEFYLDAHAFAREWAHMHHIWARLGYKQSDIKLTFRGKNLGTKPLKYNLIHNEFIVNAYGDMNEVIEAVRKLINRRQIAFLHGYPSSIYDFSLYCSDKAPDLIEKLKMTLCGILLGSEFPSPPYRDVIERTFGVPSISWYGHSEMAILAYESREKYVYKPIHAYGYCEAVPTEGGSYRLIGTSYFNEASPFIRYDTGDLVTARKSLGVVEEFRIESGRVGDFILDCNGRRISLTALIFGRHHEIFGYARFLQVRQSRPGEATIIVTIPEGMNEASIDWKNKFDSSNISIQFTFEVRLKPVRSRSGKVPLLVK